MTAAFILGLIVGVIVFYALQLAGLPPTASPQEAGIGVGVLLALWWHDRKADQ